MSRGRLKLAIASLAFVVGLAATGARAELTVIGQSVFWLSAPQAVCLNNAAARMADLPGLFETGPVEINSFDWYLIGIADTVVVEVQCIADDGTEAVVSPDAVRVLVIIEVFSDNFGVPNEADAAIVEFVGTCLLYAELCGGEIEQPPPGEAQPILLEWDESADDVDLRDQIGAQVAVVCPPYTDADPFPTSLWGTDIYTSDSDICAAAVHAGLITPGGGGTLTIEILPGQNSYLGSVRNGVESNDWGSFSASFRLIAAAKSRD